MVNITIEDIAIFYGVMICMNIEPCHLVGYDGYIKPTLFVRDICG